MSNSISLKWVEPEDNGGCEITGYIIEKRDAKRQTWVSVGTTKELEITASKLIEGNDYFFKVSAKNECGASEAVEIGPVKAKCPYGRFLCNMQCLHME